LASHHFRLVEETLEPLDPDRRAFRLVGGVLVERTVKEVLPTVKEHRNNVRIIHLSLSIYLVLLLLYIFCQHLVVLNESIVFLHPVGLPPPPIHETKLDIVVQNLKERLDTTQKDAAAWKAKYNIKTQEEMEASSGRQQ
jgi:chaperonin cofactor prefoldin